MGAAPCLHRGALAGEQVQGRAGRWWCSPRPPPGGPERRRRSPPPSWPPIPARRKFSRSLAAWGALLPGRRAGAHAVAEEEEELPVLPAEPQAGVPADLLPPAGGPRPGSPWARVGLGLGEEEAGLPPPPPPGGGCPGPGEELPPGGGGLQLLRDRDFRPEAAGLVIVDHPAGEVVAAEEGPPSFSCRGRSGG